MYPWKTVRIQDLPDINNNDEFNIPFSPGVNSGAGIYTDTFPLSSAVEQLSGRYERPNLRRTPIHSKVSDYTGELSGSLTFMDWARFYAQFLNFSSLLPFDRRGRFQFCFISSFTLILISISKINKTEFGSTTQFQYHCFRSLGSISEGNRRKGSHGS